MLSANLVKTLFQRKVGGGGGGGVGGGGVQRDAVASMRRIYIKKTWESSSISRGYGFTQLLSSFCGVKKVSRLLLKVGKVNLRMKIRR